MIRLVAWSSNTNFLPDVTKASSALSGHGCRACWERFDYFLGPHPFPYADGACGEQQATVSQSLVDLSQRLPNKSMGRRSLGVDNVFNNACDFGYDDGCSSAKRGNLQKHAATQLPYCSPNAPFRPFISVVSSRCKSKIFERQ